MLIAGQEETDRYGAPWDYASRIVRTCKECSDRSHLVVVALDELSAHNAEHRRWEDLADNGA